MSRFVANCRIFHDDNKLPPAFNSTSYTQSAHQAKTFHERKKFGLFFASEFSRQKKSAVMVGNVTDFQEIRSLPSNSRHTVCMHTV
jgi:hypothetical protein